MKFRVALIFVALCLIGLACMPTPTVSFTSSGPMIECYGDVIACTDAPHDLGSLTTPWDNLYINNITGWVPPGTHVQNTDIILTTDGATALINAGLLVYDLATDRWIFRDSNTFLGVDVAGAGTLSHTAGLEGYFNTGYGNYALYNITIGHQNTAIGCESASSITEGAYNTALGYEALIGVTTGNGNTAIGRLALGQVGTGSYNTAVGNDALYQNTGSYNTAIGLFTGHENVGGTYNVFIGNKAGYNELGSNKLYIDNSNTSTPLIYGDFSTDEVTVNDDLSVTGVIHPASMADGSASNNSIYFSTTSGKLCYKDAGGTVHDLY